MVLSRHNFLRQLAGSPGTRQSTRTLVTMLQLVPLLAVVTLVRGTGDTRVRLRLQPPLAIRSDNRRIFSSHQPRSDIHVSIYLLIYF